mmetsp:Transcript_20520/g.59481  ORF Transcript_20520/g.59481 Transcript_20520/m.59481 type:complete len:468 (-) Transcript_20520:78-1481(-)
MPEVGQLGVASRVDQQVVRAHVPVRDVPLVEGLQGEDGAAHIEHRRGTGQHLAELVEVLPQRPPGEVLHEDVVAARGLVGADEPHGEGLLALADSVEDLDLPQRFGRRRAVLLVFDALQRILRPAVHGLDQAHRAEGAGADDAHMPQRLQGHGPVLQLDARLQRLHHARRDDVVEGHAGDRPQLRLIAADHHTCCVQVVVVDQRPLPEAGVLAEGPQECPLLQHPHGAAADDEEVVAGLTFGDHMRASAVLLKHQAGDQRLQLFVAQLLQDRHLSHHDGDLKHGHGFLGRRDLQEAPVLKRRRQARAGQHGEAAAIIARAQVRGQQATRLLRQDGHERAVRRADIASPEVLLRAVLRPREVAVDNGNHPEAVGDDLAGQVGLRLHGLYQTSSLGVGELAGDRRLSQYVMHKALLEETDQVLPDNIFQVVVPYRHEGAALVDHHGAWGGATIEHRPPTKAIAHKQPRV